MTEDPRKAKTLGEACDNGDGTYNGLKALSWLSEVLNPGRGLALEEVSKIADEVKARKAAQGTSASGQDPQGLEAEPAGPTSEGGCAQ